MWCPQRPEEDIRYPGAGSTPDDVVLGTVLRSFRRAVITPTSESSLLTFVSINFLKKTNNNKNKEDKDNSKLY